MTLGRTDDGFGNPIASVDTESGRALNIYQTVNVGSVGTHMHVEDLSVGTYLFIVVDISDTVNYKHAGGVNFAHLQSLSFGITCNVQGAWAASFGFIENVTATGSTVYVYDHWRGDKDTGNNVQISNTSFPAGQQMSSNYLATHMIVSSDDFKSNVLSRSTISPDVPDTYPGNGDLFIKLVVTSGTVEEMKINVGYHSH